MSYIRLSESGVKVLSRIFDILKLDKAGMRKILNMLDKKTLNSIISQERLFVTANGEKKRKLENKNKNENETRKKPKTGDPIYTRTFKV